VASATNKQPLDLTTIRARLAGARGKAYWRSLDELAATEEFQEFLHREFPRQASEWVDPDPLSRRTFLKLMGASLALAGLSGCALARPENQAIPYVVKPDPVTPGLPLFYATAMPLGGYATGLLITSHEGRPTKVEGNVDHPASLGAADVFAQASILTLYDPDRSQNVLSGGQPSNWDAFLAALTPVMDQQRGSGGAALRILTETVTSPTLTAQIQTLLQQYPQAKWYQYEPDGNGTMPGAQLTFGQPVQAIYHFDQASVILSLDSNFLLEPAGRLRYARDFMAQRRVRDGQKQMSRLYVVESTPTITGAIADNRLPLKAARI